MQMFVVLLPVGVYLGLAARVETNVADTAEMLQAGRRERQRRRRGRVAAAADADASAKRERIMHMGSWTVTVACILVAVRERV